MVKQQAYDLADIVGKEMLAHEVRSMLTEVGDALVGLEEKRFSASEIEKALRGVAEAREVELKQIVRPLRVIFGSHGVYEAMASLGRERVVRLVRGAVVALGDRA
ncbi:MAG: hypothetical protein ABIQ44_02865 [Chloroflexia bacterium]